MVLPIQSELDQTLGTDLKKHMAMLRKGYTSHPKASEKKERHLGLHCIALSRCTRTYRQFIIYHMFNLCSSTDIWKNTNLDGMWHGAYKFSYLKASNIRLRFLHSSFLTKSVQGKQKISVIKRIKATKHGLFSDFLSNFARWNIELSN